MDKIKADIPKSRNMRAYKFMLSNSSWFYLSTEIVRSAVRIRAKNILKTGKITPLAIAITNPNKNRQILSLEYAKILVKIEFSYF